MIRKFTKVKIVAIQSLIGATPEDLETSLLRCGVNKSRVQRVIKINGFKKISTIPMNLCVGDICVISAKKLLDDVGIKASSIDGLIVMTQNPDYLVPPTSYTIQSKIGLPHPALLFDVIQGCAGYINGLLLASSLIEGGQCNRILLCNGEVTPHNGIGMLHPEASLETADGCAVTLIERDEHADPIFISVENFGELHQVVMQRDYGTHSLRVPSDATPYFVDGNKMNAFVLVNVKDHIKNFINEIRIGQLSYIMAQQSSQTLLYALATVLGVKKETIPFVSDEVGNVASASIPIALSTMKERLKIKKYDKKILLAGFGVGLCSSLAQINPNDIIFCPTIRI